MTKLTVVQGGGERDSGWTRNSIHELAIELTRAIASGNDDRNGVLNAIQSLVDKFSPEENLHRIVLDCVKALRNDVMKQDGDDGTHESEINSILEISLRLVSARMSHDSAAPARAASLERSLSIEAQRHANSQNPETKKQRRAHRSSSNEWDGLVIR
jgi:hypothetical protein